MKQKRKTKLIRIGEELHRRLKILALEQGLLMSQLADIYLLVGIESVNNKRRGKLKYNA
jgi:hypothetical protein